ncbi:CobW family GTP-binding protein [Mycolicibacterium palauense]|uniref:CobW family GTP-binding protein n=1 Tax=Mycolicibacterium palauense TaxID=2034511 RepID=UPI000BFF0AFA|nr:CobW family GTP-binding protein [Mycolicibacterium palauense]
MGSLPVIALTGHLGAGKTSLLNHVLTAPGSRIGVVVNDFGDVNVDAGLVTGQIDEPVSIAGGCICCVSEDGELDAALARLADPGLRLDAIIVEASGLADPVAIARMIGFCEVPGVRAGGVVDVIDAETHFDTVDRDAVPPARYRAASLVVVNKLDRVDTPGDTLERIRDRVARTNPRVQVVGAVGARVDPLLLYDVATDGAEPGQLSFRDLLTELAAEAPAGAHADDHDHVHADAVTVTGDVTGDGTGDGTVDPEALVALLESPPAGVYRLKGVVSVRHRGGPRRYVVNVVGTAVHVAPAPSRTAAGAPENTLVAIGMHLDTAQVRAAMAAALRPHPGLPTPAALRRLQRYR